MKSFKDIVDNKTIAVVGNSLSLFDTEYGELIDSHDAVIRFNKPAIFYPELENTQKTHGKKINVWAFVSKSSFINSVLNVDEKIETIKEKFYNDDTITKIFMKKCPLYYESNFTYPNEYYLDLSADIKTVISKFKLCKNTLDAAMSIESAKKNSRSIALRNRYNYNYTTGTQTIHWLSKLNPKSVSIFGFDFKKTPTFSEIEKFDNDMIFRYDSRCHHNFQIEELYVKEILLPRVKKFRIYV